MYKLDEIFDKIYVLVSGGIDSTYLYHKFKKAFTDKIYPVNCYNPYEQSKTLEYISKDPNYIQIKPDHEYEYGNILKEAFLQLPKARQLKECGKYNKKIFRCCYYIKHKSFLNNKMFKEQNTVVVSGIKAGDGSQRRIFLHQMRNGTFKSLNGKPSFFLRHTGGQLYMYPFRDYRWRNLPDIVIKRLRKVYPTLDHSGCTMCPVLVLFDIKKEKERYMKSINYARKLGVLPKEE